MDASRRGGRKILNMQTTIAQLSDLHLDDRMSEEFGVNSRNNIITVLNDIVNNGIEYIIITGDIGLQKSFDWLNKEIANRKLIVHYALGNHDQISTFYETDDYKNRLIENKLVYKIVINEIPILIIDSSNEVFEDDQKNIIGKYIQENTIGYIFAHHPILDCGNTFMDIKFPLKKRNDLQKYIQSKENKIIWFCGHYHNVYENNYNNIDQYVTIAVSMQIKNYSESIQIASKSFGYRKINIHENIFNTEIIVC